MIAVNLDRVTVTYVSEPVFENLSWEIHDGRVVGLIGPNGCGKSTLLKLITGELTSDTGFTVRRKGLTIGYLHQEPRLESGRTVWQETVVASSELARVEAELAHTEARLADSDVYGDEKVLTRVLDRQARLLDEYEQLGGPGYEGRVRSTLRSLGFSEADVNLPVNVLSGGQKKLVGLAKLLVTQPNLLLLDEPDNHLDLEGKAFLEQFIRGYKGAVIVRHLPRPVFPRPGGRSHRGVGGGIVDRVYRRLQRLPGGEGDLRFGDVGAGGGGYMAAYQVIVVGGGAAGLMAAGQAAELGARTLLLEKMNRPGRKLRITGKGRCNLTNVAPVSESITHFGPGGRFLRQAFSRFFNSELVAFFEELGVPTVTERGGRVFPASGQAQDVVETLVRWVGERGVALRTQSPVERLLVEGERVVGVQVSRNQVFQKKPGFFRADAVIVATGGASYPATGSTGDGYRLAEAVGHTIVPIRPALVPLETAGDVAPRLQGLSLRNVTVRVWVNGKKRAELFGEMLFTHFGLSGPIILSLSRQVVDAQRLGQRVILSIDLKPALDERRLDARLLRDLDAHGKQQFRTLLRGLLPRRLIPVCIDLTGIPPDRVGHQITAQERKRLRTWLKDFRLEVTGYRPFTEAIITAGGVDTREVDPRTMASRLVEGLHFAGEVLDVDADTGGYNLQAAFSTGWVAGRSAAR